MVVAIALVMYVGVALLVARFLSLNSRWERAIGGLIDADLTRFATAGAGAGSAPSTMTVPAAPGNASVAARESRVPRHRAAEQPSEEDLVEV